MYFHYTHLIFLVMNFIRIRISLLQQRQLQFSSLYISGKVIIDRSNQHNKNMFKNQFEETLQHMVKTFNIFIHLATSYSNIYGCSDNTGLVQMVSLWVHPKGLGNLIKIISHEFQTEATSPKNVRHQDVIIQAKSSDQAQSQSQQINQIAPQTQKSLSKSKLSKRITKNIQKKKKEEIQVYEDDQNGEQQGFNISQSLLQVQQISQFQDKKYKRGPYKNYTTEEKIRAVEMYFQQRLSITQISKKFGIPCKNIKRWATEGVLRKSGGGRRRTNPRLEDSIYKWVIGQHAAGQNVSLDLIQEYALSLSRDPQFKASRGWAIKFIDRYRLREDFNIV